MANFYGFSILYNDTVVKPDAVQRITIYVEIGFIEKMRTT